MGLQRLLSDESMKGGGHTMINTTGWKEIDKLFEKAHQLYAETEKLNIEIEKAMRFHPNKDEGKNPPCRCKVNKA